MSQQQTVAVIMSRLVKPRSFDSDFEPVFSAVAPRAGVRPDGDDIRAELRSVGIVAFEEAVGCVNLRILLLCC